MKNLKILLAAAVLSTPSFVLSQEKPNETGKQITIVEQNPFLVEKRHGAVFTYSYYSKNQIDENTSERNPFMLDKRHNSVFTTSSNVSNSILANLEVERNPFLFDKRHGAIFMMNKSITNVAKGHQEVRSRNIFLEQKRHQ